MSDKVKKTKEQLFEEIESLQQRIMQLEKEHEFYSQVIENVKEAVSIIDAEGRFLFCNSVAAKLLGGNSEDIVGKTLHDVLQDRKEADDRLTEIKKIIGTGKGGVVDLHINLKDGEHVFLASTQSIRDDEGKTVSVLNTSLDITERKKAERKLHESEEQLRLITDNLPVLISYVDRDLQYKFVNKQYEEWFETPQKNIVGKHVKDVIGKKTYKKIKGDLTLALSGETVSYEHYSTYPNDVDRYIRSTVVPHIDDTGEVKGLFTVVNDLSNRKKIEEALNASQQRFKAIFEHVQAGIIIIDEDTHVIVDVNTTAARMIGYPKENIIGKECYNFVCPAEKGKCPITDLRETINKSEEILIDITGTEIPILKTVVPMNIGEKRFLVDSFVDITALKQAELTLRESESKFRQLAENVNEVFWIGSPDWQNVFYISPAYETIWGLSCKSLYKKPVSWFENIVPEDRKKVEKIIIKGISSKKKYIVFPEYRITRLDGSIRWIYARAYPIKNDRGEVYRIAGVAEDITERKQMEESLRESEYFNEEIISCAGEGIAVYDTELRYLLWNKYMEEISGVPAKEVLGKNALELFPHLKERRVDKLLKRALAGKTVKSPDTPFYIPSTGKKGWVVGVYSPHKNTQGEIVGVVAAIREISARKKAEEEIEKLSRFPSENPNPVLRFDKNGELLYVNMAGGTMMDMWSQVEKGTVQDILHEYGENILSVDQTVQHEVEIQDRTYSLTFAPFKEAGYVNVYGLDITVQKRLEDNLRQSQKMEAIGQLAGGIAHDFNNQLSGILGYADLIREDVGDDPTLTRYADNILISTKRAADLTSQLLAFARKGKYLSVPVNIHKVLFEIVSLLEHSIDKRIALNQELHANPPVTIGDPSQLQNALLNVALNARDAMPEGGELILSTDIADLDENYCKNSSFDLEPGRYIKVGISDSGVGMSDDMLEHIFEPFFTTKEVGKGTGMGLAAVYGAVKNHKGAIVVTSEIGKGSSFSVYLPLAEMPGISPEEDNVQRIIKGSAHILLVDDEKIVHDIGCDILQSLGYTVTVCSDGNEAVEYYKKSWKDIALVILDLVMPEMGGGEAFKIMKEINPDIRVLVSSGYSINGEARDLLRSGAKGFIQKPFRKVEISQKIAEVLDITE